MIGRPAGWFRDPAPRDPLSPDTWRYWNGIGWTAQTRTGTKRQRREWREQVAEERREHRRDLYERARLGDEDAHWQLMALNGPEASGRATGKGRSAGGRGAAFGGAVTAGGERYAGWWRRYGASTVDAWLIALLGLLLGWPYVSRAMAEYTRYVHTLDHAQRRRAAVPDPAAMVDAVGRPFLLAGLIVLAVSLVYEVCFLKRCQATPGKLLFGLRVRSGESDAPLSWGAVLLRWSGKSGVGLLQLLPFGLLAVAVYALSDGLWPLWDRRHQSVHDKLARTYVVRRA